jgi:hypothetical protein
VPVNPGDLLDSAIEIRTAEWDLVYIAIAQDDGDDKHAYDAQKVAYDCSWDDLDLESIFEYRSEEGLMVMRGLRLSASGLFWCFWLRFGQPERTFLRSRTPRRAIGLARRAMLCDFVLTRIGTAFWRFIRFISLYIMVNAWFGMVGSPALPFLERYG